MKKILIATLSVALLWSCGRTDPQKTFSTAVLNANLFYGFAGEATEAELARPSIKLTNAATGEPAPMRRREVVDQKIAKTEENLSRIKALRPDADAAAMVKTSIALHEYVLQALRNDYAPLADRYDRGATAAETARAMAAIRAKHSAPFSALAAQLMTEGKTYAAAHKLNVGWDIRP